MLLLRLVFAIGGIALVNGAFPSYESTCGLYYCPYSCDLMLSYIKLFVRDSIVNNLTFLNVTPFKDGEQRSDIDDHSSVCMCDSFLDQLHLCLHDLETYEFSKGSTDPGKCFIMTHANEDGSTEDEAGDGIFVILLLVVVAFVLWITAVISVTWYAHCKRVSRHASSEEIQNLMTRESFAIHSMGVSTVRDQVGNHTPVNANQENKDSPVRDVAVITLYSGLPSMPGTRLPT